MSRESEFAYVAETRSGFIASIDSDGVVMVALTMRDAMRVTIDFAHSPLLARVAEVSPMAIWLVPYVWDGKP